MEMYKIFFIIGVCMTFVIGVDLACGKQRFKEGLLANIDTTQDIVNLFPATIEEIEYRVNKSMEEAKNTLSTILAIADDQRTFENTAQALDRLSTLSDLCIVMRALHVLSMVSPDEALRNAAHEQIQHIENFIIDSLTLNVALYKAFKAYAEGNATQEQLSEEQRYFVTETMKEFRRSGLHLPEATREKIRTVSKELTKLSQDFERNVAEETRTISVSADALQGLDQDFIDALPRDEAGLYKLGVDYPTYFNVMENCSVEGTRKALWHLFMNRAYPKNESVLKAVIAKRDELAQLLGFSDYAHYNLDDSMVQKPERAQAFLDEVLGRATIKANKEFATITQTLPEGITLTSAGTIKPWDWGYVKATYKKKHLAVDERRVAEYFPMEKTIAELLDIYHQFLGIDFKEVPISGLWHSEVRLVEVSDANTRNTLGYLLLDLYPRPNKYGHACEMSVIKAITQPDGNKPAALALVIANFPKSTSQKPSLLKRNDVETFFHEFGHALHELLGRTTLASLAGTNVKRDFVEMPSQMLEEWLGDRAILKKVSGHYVTGESLSDELIDKIEALKYFDSGDTIQRQVYLAKLSLACYGPGADKDPYHVMHGLQSSIRKYISNEPEDHMYTSFGHLMGYGAQYYGYLWSKVFALDMFKEIEKQGLLNPVIGKKYINDVIGCGGSKDPNALLVHFLGREPNSDAFFADLGI